MIIQHTAGWSGSISCSHTCGSSSASSDKDLNVVHDYHGMRTLEETLEIVEKSHDDMVETMIGMISIPALAPINGGDGESRKADYLQGKLTGFDSVRRIDVPDDVDPSVMRSNILAVRNGKLKGTVWVMAHMDVVPAGDPELWDNPPYEPVFRDGRVYGRGTEDNGQSVISSMFASRAVIDQELNGMSLGIAYVADEETTSLKGIRYLLDQGVFTDDDIIIVPDWGSPGGGLVEVAEKSVLWLKVSVEGKTCHGSSPQSGLNAYRVSTYLLADLMDRLPERFPARDDMFRPPESTFEPTKRPATVENVNTIPGHDEFCMDTRILPCYDVDEVLSFIRSVASEHAERTGAAISVDIIQCEPAGRASSTSTLGFSALCDAVERVTGNRPSAVGVGGGTCANFFRVDGFNAYVWQCGGGTLHAPNEYVEMSNLMTDAKVFATLFHDLCVVGRE